MFDILVESSKRKNGKRASRYFVVTTAIYAIALLAIGIGTVISFSPALAEEYSLAALIAPPVPTAPSVPQLMPKLQNNTRQDAPLDIWIPPTKLVVIPNFVDAANSTQPRLQPGTPGGLPPGVGDPNGCIGCKVAKEESAPPKPPPPLETLTSASPKETKPGGTTKVSEGVLQGSAIKKQVPVYTAIAKAARASGMVQVVVTISEEGRVLDAQVINGHPLLRQAAADAARQWVFTPTKLSNVPVKVQGVLSFNFVLQ